MPALTNSRGEMTNAVYGFTSMLLKVLNEHHPTYAIAAFDLPGPTFRHEEFADYKAQRPPTPPEIVRQMPWSRQVVEAMSIPIVEIPGFEADDVIGTLARRAEAAGLDVLILTGDLDALQLVTPHVRVYATRRGITDTVVYDVDKVFERYGFDRPRWSTSRRCAATHRTTSPAFPASATRRRCRWCSSTGRWRASSTRCPA